MPDLPALGALYGHLLVGISELSDTVISAYAIVGMGAFLSSVTYAPLMSILMIFEMTLSYEAVLPLMLACVVVLLLIVALLASLVPSFIAASTEPMRALKAE